MKSLRDKPCPCTKNCKGRSATCHSTCAAYIIWDIEHKEYNTAIRAEKFKQSGFPDMFARQEVQC